MDELQEGANHIYDNIEKISKEGDHVTGMRSNLQSLMALHEKVNNLKVHYPADVNGKRQFLAAHEAIIQAYMAVVNRWIHRRTADEDHNQVEG